MPPIQKVYSSVRKEKNQIVFRGGFELRELKMGAQSEVYSVKKPDLGSTFILRVRNIRNIREHARRICTEIDLTTEAEFETQTLKEHEYPAR